MSILWCGGEEIDFPNGNIPAMGTTAGCYRSGWARGHINVPTAGQIAKSVVFPGGEVTSCWLSYRWRIGSVGANTSKRYGGLGKSGTTKGIFVGTSAASVNRLAILRFDGTTQDQLAYDSAGNVNFSLDTLYKIDLELISYGASSTIRLYIDGVKAAELLNGDSSITGVGGFDSVFLYCPITTLTPMSEVIVADEDTRSFALRTHYPDAAGDANGWTGAYSDVDETSVSDADLMYVNSGDADAQLNLLATPTGTFGVKAVMESVRAVKSADATPNGIALGVKTGGSFDYGSKQDLTVSWFTYQRLMNTNPVTTNPWTDDELDALQMNLRAKT